MSFSQYSLFSICLVLASIASPPQAQALPEYENSVYYGLLDQAQSIGPDQPLFAGATHERLPGSVGHLVPGACWVHLTPTFVGSRRDTNDNWISANFSPTTVLTREWKRNLWEGEYHWARVELQVDAHSGLATTMTYASYELDILGKRTDKILYRRTCKDLVLDHVYRPNN